MNLRRADLKRQQNGGGSGDNNNSKPVTEVVVVTKTAPSNPNAKSTTTHGVLLPTASNPLSGGSSSPHPSSQSLNPVTPTGNPSAASSTPSGSPTLSPDQTKSSGVTAGGVFGGLLAIGAFVGLIFFAARYYRKKSVKKNNTFNASHFRRSGLALTDSPKSQTRGLPPLAGAPKRSSSGGASSPMMTQTPAVPAASFPYADQAQHSADPYGQYASSAHQHNVSAQGADGQITSSSIENSGVNISGATYGQHASYGNAPPYPPPVPESQNPFVAPAIAPVIASTPHPSNRRSHVGSIIIPREESPFVTPPASPEPPSASASPHVVEPTSVLQRKSTASIASSVNTSRSSLAETNIPEVSYVEVQRGEVAVPAPATVIEPVAISPHTQQQQQTLPLGVPAIATRASFVPAVRVPVPASTHVVNSGPVNDPTSVAAAAAPAVHDSSSSSSVNAGPVHVRPTSAQRTAEEVRPTTMYDEADAYGGY